MRKLGVMIGLVLVAVSAAAAVAKPQCERRCTKAETCPIAGLKCLSFDICRDVCTDDATGEPANPDGEGARPEMPKLPDNSADKEKHDI